MIGEQTSEKKRKTLLSNVIQKVVKRKGYSEIKSKAEGFDAPTTLRRVDDSITCTPDISARKNGRKSYFEIAIKPKKDALKERVISKWKLLQQLATMRHGKLYIVAPHGNFAYTKRVCDKHNIDAVIVKYK
jgi:hypothetical protein